MAYACTIDEFCYGTAIRHIRNNGCERLCTVKINLPIDIEAVGFSEKKPF